MKIIDKMKFPKFGILKMVEYKISGLVGNKK
jgi:hypothetical protein